MYPKGRHGGAAPHRNGHKAYENRGSNAAARGAGNKKPETMWGVGGSVLWMYHVPFPPKNKYIV